MKISYEITEDDYLEAYRLTLMSSSRLYRIGKWLVIPVGALCVGVSILTLAISPFSATNLVPLMIGVFILITPWRVRRKARSIYRQAHQPYFQVTAEFDDSGVHLTTPLGSGNSQWEAYQKYAEGPNVFALIMPTRVSHIVPKRGLSAEEISALRVIIGSRLQKA